MDKTINVDGALLRDMFIAGAALLEQYKAHVDSLNVFPVPDGDTGTNMSMTINAAVKEIKQIPADKLTVANVASSMSKGALRGARGNSGVILSQLFRGMARVLEKHEELDSKAFAQALIAGSEAAYKAVMKPKEGTILTVAKYVATCALEHAEDGYNIYKMVDSTIADGERVLAKTPDMLPVLKEAGVVDSGGKGLVIIYRGFKMALDGDSIDETNVLHDSEVLSERDENALIEATEDIVYGYCTEFFIQRLNSGFKESDIDKLRDSLMRIGDSVVAVYDADIVKIHVHTNMPGKALQLALRLGEVDSIKIENMREQNRRILEERKACEKEIGMVAISVGEGIEKVFRDLGVDSIVSGGQTMNPSAEDIERAVKRVNARNVFVLPNNKNIILAANQAAEMLEGKVNVIVIPSKSISQGVTSALAYDASGDIDTLTNEMTSALDNVKSGSVTCAVRDTKIKDMEIKIGNFIAMADGELVATDAELGNTLDMLLENMIDDSAEYVTIFYGQDVTLQDAQAFADSVSEEYTELDVVLQQGGQPLYHYLISVE